MNKETKPDTEPECIPSNITIDTLPQQYSCIYCANIWFAGDPRPKCHTNQDTEPEKVEVTWPDILDRMEQDTQPEGMEERIIEDMLSAPNQRFPDTQPEGMEERLKLTLLKADIPQLLQWQGEVLLDLLKQEISLAERRAIEKIIEEIPDCCGYYTCDMGDCMEPTKEQLRTKHL